MAENERLDVLKNKRWRRVLECIQAGATDDDAVRLIGTALAKTLRRAMSQIPLAELIKRASQHDSTLRRLALGCHHDFAELVTKVVAEGATDHSIGQQYVGAVLDRFLDQMGLELAGCPAYPTFDAFVAQSTRWKESLAQEIERLGQCVEADVPNIRSQPQPAHVRAADVRRLANLSLLNRRGIHP
jgi:hypothetical protein